MQDRTKQKTIGEMKARKKKGFYVDGEILKRLIKEVKDGKS